MGKIPTTTNRKSLDPTIIMRDTITQLANNGQASTAHSRLYELIVSELVNLREANQHLSATIKESHKLTATKVREAGKNANASAKRFEDAVSKINKVIKDKETELTDVMKRAKEFAKYQALDKYFETKARSHYIQFSVWLGLFVASLISIFICFNVYYADLKDFLPDMSANNFKINGGVLIIATTLMVVWVLRVFIRLAMLNLQLAEDASNRTVLIRTLAALEAEQENDLPNEQKIIAYNAIFRASLSDNSNLDVAQPGLGDLSGLFNRK